MQSKNGIVIRDFEEDDMRIDSDGDITCYWRMARAFTEKRHTEKIEAFQTVTQTWRMKERMKTVSVALVLCLNVGIDPPDVVKINPCSRLECWVDPFMYIDPSAGSNQKATEMVGANLQHQYERWQPRARYKLSLDPTIDDVKKLCVSLRRNAKDERVLFHYNGHGVPRPTANGEIWVFNKNFTQYIPLSIFDLHLWMGSPSIYVFDCSSGGSIVDYVKKHLVSGAPRDPPDIQMPDEGRVPKSSGAPTETNSTACSLSDCIHLAACQANELLPMNPELPADLFTSCLTTPIKIALRWFVLHNSSRLVPGINMDLVDKVPGLLNDRRTMLGELNWIFTAITDTIAWNVLSRDLFQKLFRQDLLVASLFRNFLLAERIMRSYNCTPVSSPRLQPTYQHPLWHAWDLALDRCLAQLPKLLEDSSAFEHSTFFAEQLTAFQVWLTYGSEKRNPPEQLPIVLQVLLSQVHRQRALELLGRFLDFGPWAVNLALSVGIFPYVLKLLQSSARELRALLVFIWSKLLAVDSVRVDLSSCQADLVKDSGHKYFLSILSDQSMSADHRTMAAFILTMIVNNNQTGQEAAVQGNLIALCLEQLNDPHPLLRQWLALCLGKVWTNYDAARWCGVRDTAHEKLYPFLTDPVPEVRAAVVSALGTFMNNSTDRNDHANSIDQGVATKLLTVLNDGSPLVRKELVVALSGFVSQFELQFTSVALQLSEDEKEREYHTVTGTVGVWNAPNESASFLGGGMRRSVSTRNLKGFTSTFDALDQFSGPMKRNASTSSVFGASLSGFGGVYTSVWKVLLSLSNDPFPAVADMARKLCIGVRQRMSASGASKQIIQQRKSSLTSSAPSSPSNRPGTLTSRNTFSPGEQNETAMPRLNEPNQSSNVRSPGSTEQAPQTVTSRPSTSNSSTPQQLSRTRKALDKIVDSINESEEQSSSLLQSTEFFEWCCKYFTEPLMSTSPDGDPHGLTRYEHEYRFKQALQTERLSAEEYPFAKNGRIDESIFINRNLAIPSILRFHPYENQLMATDKDHVSIWDWEQGTRLSMFSNRNPKHSRITYADFINCHDVTLIMTGSDDGNVKVYRNYCTETGSSNVEMVSAWQGLNDMLPTSKGSGLVMDWDQYHGIVYTSGDVRVVRLWDAEKELKVQELPTGADCCITSLSLDQTSQNVVVGGCGDGSVRVFDKRLPPNECLVQLFREHQTWVVKAYALSNHKDTVLSASANGDMRLWDVRSRDSYKVIPTSEGLTAIDVHKHVDIMAWSMEIRQKVLAKWPQSNVFYVGTITEISGKNSFIDFGGAVRKISTASLIETKLLRVGLQVFVEKTLEEATISKIGNDYRTITVISKAGIEKCVCVESIAVNSMEMNKLKRATKSRNTVTVAESHAKTSHQAELATEPGNTTAPAEDSDAIISTNEKQKKKATKFETPVPADDWEAESNQHPEIATQLKHTTAPAENWNSEINHQPKIDSLDTEQPEMVTPQFEHTTAPAEDSDAEINHQPEIATELPEMATQFEHTTAPAEDSGAEINHTPEIATQFEHTTAPAEDSDAEINHQPEIATELPEMATQFEHTTAPAEDSDVEINHHPGIANEQSEIATQLEYTTAPAEDLDAEDYHQPEIDTEQPEMAAPQFEHTTAPAEDLDAEDYHQPEIDTEQPEMAAPQFEHTTAPAEDSEAERNQQPEIATQLDHTTPPKKESGAFAMTSSESDAESMLQLDELKDDSFQSDEMESLLISSVSRFLDKSSQGHQKPEEKQKQKNRDLMDDCSDFVTENPCQTKSPKGKNIVRIDAFSMESSESDRESVLQLDDLIDDSFQSDEMEIPLISNISRFLDKSSQGEKLGEKEKQKNRNLMDSCSDVEPEDVDSCQSPKGKNIVRKEIDGKRRLKEERISTKQNVGEKQKQKNRNLKDSCLDVEPEDVDPCRSPKGKKLVRKEIDGKRRLKEERISAKQKVGEKQKQINKELMDSCSDVEPEDVDSCRSPKGKNLVRKEMNGKRRRKEEHSRVEQKLRDEQSSISDDSASSLYVPSDEESDIVNERRFELDDLYVKWSQNGKNKRVFDKKHYCLYCERPSTNLTKHVLNKHKEEDLVKEAVAHRINSDLRKLLFEKIRNLGDFHHNCSVIRQGRGEIIPWRCPPHPEPVHEYVPCPCCFAFFQERQLWRHHQQCQFCVKKDRKHSFRSLRMEAHSLLPSNNKISSAMENKVFSKMTRDEITIIARNDPTITRYGEKLFQKHGHLTHLHAHISCKMRELARLVRAIREIDNNVIFLSDALYPEKFESVVKAVHSMCGFSSESNKYAIPSLALKIGHALKKCCAIEICSSIKKQDGEKKDLIQDFIYLCEKEWESEVSSAALTTLTAEKLNKPQVLPLTEDLKLMNAFLEAETKRLTEQIQSNPSARSWNSLSQLTLTSTVLFNRRRGGEAQRLLLVDYQNRNKNSLVVKDIADSLSKVEQFLCKSMTIVEVRGKMGRTVPIIITPSLLSAIDLLNITRSVVGVPESNPYVFARPNYDTAQRASDCLRHVALKCGAKNPSNVTSTRLRKHIASTAQILNLQEFELDLLAGFLGHDIRIHRNFYRLPQDTLRLAKVSKILMAFDSGKISQFKGKSLDEIEVDIECDEEEELSSEYNIDDHRNIADNKSNAEMHESQQSDEHVTSTTSASLTTNTGGWRVKPPPSVDLLKLRARPRQSSVIADDDDDTEWTPGASDVIDLRSIRRKHVDSDKPRSKKRKLSDVDDDSRARKMKTRAEKDFDDDELRSRSTPKNKSEKETNDERQFSDEDEQLTARSETRAKRRGAERRPWLQQEKYIVKKHMMEHIVKGQIPKKSDIEQWLTEEPSLINRSWQNIKDFVRNSIVAHNRAHGKDNL